MPGKKRGRPPKEEATAPPSGESKKRGRPRKESTPKNETAKAPPSKSPGRPSKETKDEAKSSQGKASKPAQTSSTNLGEILEQRAKDAAEKRNKEIEKDNLPLAQQFWFLNFARYLPEGEDKNKTRNSETPEECWKKGMFLIMPRGAVGSCLYHYSHLGEMIDEHDGGGTYLGVFLLHNLMYPIADAYRDIKDVEQEESEFLLKRVSSCFTNVIGATFAALNLAEYLYDNDDPGLYEAVWTYLGKTWKRLLPHLVPQKVLDQEGHDTLIRILERLHDLIDEDCHEDFDWKPTQEAYSVARKQAQKKIVKKPKSEIEKRLKEAREREKQKRLASSNPILTIDERLEHLHNSEGKSLKEASTITGIKEGTLAKWRKQEEEMWFLSAIGRGDDTKCGRCQGGWMHQSKLILGQY